MRAGTPGRVEFVALMAMLVATVAFSIDAMLPALPRIGQELTPEALNRAQLIVTSFILGLGVGTFFTGPLSDSFGRKRVILCGAAVYMAGAALAAMAPTLELILAARVLQGLGAATARVVPLAIIRDLYSGREMARIVSFVMMVFTLAPAVAPLVGSGIIVLAGWRGIFGSFILFATISSLWLTLRLAEPLPREARRPFSASALKEALRAVLAPPVVRIAIAVQTLCLTTLFSSISSIQQLFEVTFHRADQFPLWFFMMAICAGTGSFLNASLVMRLGMRRMISATLALQIGLTSIVLALFLIGLPEGLRFPVYLVWQTTIFFQAALTLGNINALAMEPLGHVAGMAASVVGALATVGSVILTIPVGLAFDGTPLPLLTGVLVAVSVARYLMVRLHRAEEYA
ncbi:multidrug effflux MFS transporter [Roseovarius sp. A21]|uniref:Multidrug effflux MFS transporter n=1 Tax=Roseovarius bejariae TaxID=2576383 RepID=A0A844CGM3_9RHOB|nr:MFS transporter [Roseovarius bejariae]MRU13842.1 multidrug effflux MFS transporter [Roseovarius bejariae]